MPIMSSKLNPQMTIKWDSHGDFIVMTIGIPSQNNRHVDFLVKSSYNDHMRIMMRRMKYPIFYFFCSDCDTYDYAWLKRECHIN